MTPELKMQLRIAILESLGWHVMRPVINGCILARKDQKDGWSVPSDPTNCLNAMHDAEKHLQSEHLANYFDYLCHRVIDGSLLPAGCVWHATAAQRAEAFCRTLKIGPFAE